MNFPATLPVAISLLAGILSFFAHAQGGEPVVQGSERTVTPGPDAIQNDLIERGYGMFIHFGINTFNNIEWSDGKLPVESYQPTNLDPASWVRTAKEAGFRYVVLTVKHHDGFCLWDSAVTTYDVASTSVPTDVVKAVADACAAEGIRLGIYYSLWDRHEPSYRDDEAYIEFIISQLRELMTNYGPVCELWFDGAWDKPDENWGLPRLAELVRALQPGCAIATNHTIAIPGRPRSIQQPVNYAEGNPIRFWPNDFRLKDPDLARWDDPKLYTSPED